MSNRVAIAVFALCTVMLASICSAEAEIGFKGVGANLGIVKPENIDATVGFGGFVDLGKVMPNLGIGAGLDFWSKDMNGAKTRDIAIGATGKYFVGATDAKLHPYVGAGLAYHMLKVTAPTVTILGVTYGGGDVTDSKVGFDLLGGALYGVKENINLLGELRYRLVSDFNMLDVRVGAEYLIGK
jgi:opacity protein-like surface antigen